MRTPKGKSKKAKAKAKAPEVQAMSMETDAGPSSSAPSGPPAVWRPGIDPIGEDEELDYDPTAYDCLHRFQLDWPCLSFDIVGDDLGAPRSAFPHALFMIAGTQADTARNNYLAVVRLVDLGQGRHGKKGGAKAAGGDDDSDEESSSEEDDDMSEEGEDEKEPPPRLHIKTVPHMGGINRVRVMPQQPGIVAAWSDNGSVRVYDVTAQLKELAGETEPKPKAAQAKVAPLQSHAHATEGFALDWSPAKAGRLATGDCRKSLHVWEPQEGGRWQVSSSYSGHEDSVEDLQWSPAEETVFASCSVDKTIRVWDVRQRNAAMITAQAHDADVNVISWNRLVNYMMASGGDDGSLRIWDLRSFSSGSYVSNFQFHKSYITSVEWCPYEGSMLATSGGDDQLAVWDLAVERDPEEEAALAAEGNATAPDDLPPQLLFVHAGQKAIKELHWHPQIPGMIVDSAEDFFNVFKPANV